jgi:methionyl-tRNA formyltransferase
LAVLGPEILEPTIAKLVEGTAQRIKQDETLASYAPKLERDSGRIDWTQSAFYLDRLIRAMNPWPGAYTVLNSPEGPRRLKLHRVLPMHRLPGKPAVVTHHVRRGIVVGTGAGSLLLLEVQLEGKRRMSAAEFLRGFSVPVGTEMITSEIERDRAGTP